jgi:hypothetical protein
MPPPLFVRAKIKRPKKIAKLKKEHNPHVSRRTTSSDKIKIKI